MLLTDTGAIPVIVHRDNRTCRQPRQPLFAVDQPWPDPPHEMRDLCVSANLRRPMMLDATCAFGNTHLDLCHVDLRPNKKNADVLRAQLDEGQIPDFRVVQSLVDLAPDHRAMYDDVVAKRFPKTGLPMDPLAAVTYTQMICDAPQVLGLDTVTPPAKLAELLRLLQHDYAGSKVLVFSRYASVCRWLQQELTVAGYPTGLITGDVSVPDRLAAISAFQDGPAPAQGPANPAPPTPRSATSVLVLSAAGGESLNLQQARVMVLYDLPWSGGDVLQLLGRIRRHGSKHASVLFHVLTAERTVDTVVPQVLYAQLHVIASLHLHSHSSSSNPSPSNSSHPTPNTASAASNSPTDNSSTYTSSKIAAFIRTPLDRKISTYQLEAVLRAVTGSDKVLLEAKGFPPGQSVQIPSSEEAVNSTHASTSLPATPKASDAVD